MKRGDEKSYDTCGALLKGYEDTLPHLEVSFLYHDLSSHSKSEGMMMQHSVYSPSQSTAFECYLAIE